MEKINWNNGHLIKISQGKVALCSRNLEAGQLYGLFFYNSAHADSDTELAIVGTNQHEEKYMTVPGTTADQGLASVCFVSGNDTDSIAVQIISENDKTEVTAFICGVGMPHKTDGISNRQLKFDHSSGKEKLERFTRLFGVPASQRYRATISSNQRQFISVQFEQHKAIVLIVNSFSDPSNVIEYFGNAQSSVTIEQPSSRSSKSWSFRGNGRQTVWVNADSIQNSEYATFSWTSLSPVFEMLEE